MGKWSAEELASLTDDERAGMLDETLADDPPGTTDEDVDDPTEPVAAKAAEPKPADPPVAGADAATVDPAPAAAPSPSPAVEQQPIVVKPPVAGFQAPADAQQRIDALDKAIDAIEKKFDEGEVTATERRAQLRTLEKDRADLEYALRYEASALDNSKVAWETQQVPAFFAKHGEYADPDLYDMLDEEVRSLQTAAINKAGNGYAQYNPNFLDQAHANLVNRASKLTGRPAPAPNPVGGFGKHPTVPTLAHVPASDMPNPAGDTGAFAYLDRLMSADPVKFERELAKLPADARERYLGQ